MGGIHHDAFSFKYIDVNQQGFAWSLTKRIKQVPEYLWMSFIFGIIAVGGFYFLVPKIWVGNMMCYALNRQIIVTMVISHFGLFDGPIKLI